MISTVVVSVGAVVLGLALLGAGTAALFVYVRREIMKDKRDEAPMELRLAALELTVQGLPSIWEDERARTQRAADAARAARKSAEDKLEEVQELIESQEELPLLDEGGIEERGVPPMRARLGDPPAPNRRERAAAVAHLLR